MARPATHGSRTARNQDQLKLSGIALWHPAPGPRVPCRHHTRAAPGRTHGRQGTRRPADRGPAEPHHQADTAATRNGSDLAAVLDRLETQLADHQAEQQTLQQARSGYAARMTREAEHQAQAEPETHHDELHLET